MQNDNSQSRPTKKQFELLQFIEQFIAEHGYGPSYREIMAGRSYTSVATVAVHVNNLVATGYLIKKGRSARSLEVTNYVPPKQQLQNINPDNELWLIQKIEVLFAEAEKDQPTKQQIDNLYVLVGALKVLGFDSAAISFTPRLKSLKQL